MMNWSKLHYYSVGMIVEMLSLERYVAVNKEIRLSLKYLNFHTLVEVKGV